VLCLVLFLVFLGGWGFVAYLGIQGGDIIRVIYPTDSQVKIDLFPNLYLSNRLKD
jgi:hypothetical protein